MSVLLAIQLGAQHLEHVRAEDAARAAGRTLLARHHDETAGAIRERLTMAGWRMLGRGLCVERIRPAGSRQTGSGRSRPRG